LSTLLSCLSTTQPPPTPTLFPYTTLFRSHPVLHPGDPVQEPPRLRVPGVFVGVPDQEPGRAPRGDAPGRGDQAVGGEAADRRARSEEHTSELQSRFDLVCRLLLEKKKKKR